MWDVGWEEDDEEQGPKLRNSGMNQKRIQIRYPPRQQFGHFHSRKQRWEALVCHRRGEDGR